MREPSQRFVQLFWEYPEYWNAWRLAFETPHTRRNLLPRLLNALPESWGRVEFLEECGSDTFVVLLTHDLDNDGGRRNEFQIIIPLIESNALKFIGAEGATGRIDLNRFHQFPFQNSVRAAAEYLFRTRKISPLIAAAFYTTIKPELWGVEDPDLYRRTKASLLEGGRDYRSLIYERSPVLYENLLLMMSERSEPIAGITITEFNFDQGHSYLKARGISHAGIRSASIGPTEFGRTIEEMKAPPSPLEKLFEQTSREEEAKKDAEYTAWKEAKGREPL